MPRRGHSRPAGTVWKCRMRDCDPKRPPQLGDLYFEKPIELGRGYEVVGIEETSDPAVWRMHLERVLWHWWLKKANVLPDERVHGFTRDPPKPRLRLVT